MKINAILQPGDIIPALGAATKDEVLAELAAKVEENHPGLKRQELLQILQERERLGSTGIGDGIAIPHGKLREARELVMVFGRSRTGVDFNALDCRPVYLFFLLVAPDDAIGIHLKMLARISRILKDPAVRKALLEASDAAAIHAIIREQDSRY